MTNNPRPALGANSVHIASPHQQTLKLELEGEGPDATVVLGYDPTDPDEFDDQIATLQRAVGPDITVLPF